MKEIFRVVSVGSVCFSKGRFFNWLWEIFRVFSSGSILLVVSVVSWYLIRYS